MSSNQEFNAQLHAADQQDSILHFALDYARRGWPVFPCSPHSKAPLVPGADKDENGEDIPKTGGLYRATTDEAQIRAWWARWPNAMIGVRMGACSGLWALDPDAPEEEGDPDGVAYWAALCARHPKLFTHTHLTPGGGQHKIFKWNPDRPVGTKEGFLKDKGINVRGEGGYVIAPPSRRLDGKQYEIEDPLDYFHFADAPDWLYDLIDPRSAPRPSISERAKANMSAPPGSHRRYAEAALHAEVGQLAKGTAGNRNNGLNTAAFKLGQLVGVGELSEGEVYDALYNACVANGLVKDDGPRSVDATIKSGLQAGIKEPRQIPERQARELPSTVWEDVEILSKQKPSQKEQQTESPSTDPEKEQQEQRERQQEQQEEREAASERAEVNGVTLDDFYAYMPMHSYIFVLAREPWPAGSVNSRIEPVPLFDAKGQPILNKKGEQATISASTWLDKNRPVEQMTWAPGHPAIIHDRLISEGGWIEREGVTCLNLYRPPTIKPGDAEQAAPWIDHIRRIYPDDADRIIMWLAFKAQHPAIKINHALVLGGKQGIGKDTLLEPVKDAVGSWNFTEVSPTQMLGRFNGFVKSVILRVSEARDLGDVTRFQFYDHMKVYTAAPPDVLRVDEKNLREHAVFNVCGVIITTNHKADGIYLPSDDRRHYVTWSDATKEDFNEAYWNKMWQWYEHGGIAHVVAYLLELDLARFNPKAPPPKTPAFWAIVDANCAPEDAELADAIDLLGRPEALTIGGLVGSGVSDDFAEWLKDRKNRRVLPHRLERCGYTPVRNEYATDGLWKINGRRQAVYAKAGLSHRERLQAVQKRGG
jgi:hypothetical protein